MELATVLFACVLALIAIVRSPRISAPQLVAPVQLHWSLPDEDEEDEQQQPQKHRARGVPQPLLWAVGSAAVLRAVAFVALGS